MRILKLMIAAGLLASTAACTVYTRDYAYDGYYGYHYEPAHAYSYRYN